MPFITIKESPLLQGVSPVEIHYREYGDGSPLLFLHGGWGYEVYPFDSQIEAFGGDFKIVIPDRSGYGRSMPIETLPVDFHHRAAIEMMSFLSALEIEKPILWGHSDGAVIAALMGMKYPDRFAGIILEAFHFYRNKPGSKQFFETMAHNPDQLGERVCNALARDHGAEKWKGLIVKNGGAWLELAEQANGPEQDLYEGRLSSLSTPAMFIHGSEDPRTEPGELDAVREQLKSAQMNIISGGGHAPHSQKSVIEECNQLAGEFFSQLNLRER